MDYYREVMTDDPFRRSERENPRTVETSQAMRCGVRGSANPSDREVPDTVRCSAGGANQEGAGSFRHHGQIARCAPLRD
jgi:hypothetical protein